MFIKRPGGMRRHYAIVVNGTTVIDARVDNINFDLDRGHPRDVLELRLKTILNSYKAIKVSSLSYTNLALVNECHASKLRRKGRSLVAPEGLKYPLVRSAEWLGHVPLKEVGENELIGLVARINDPWKAFYIIKGLNELLRFSKRGFVLFNPKPVRRDIRFITLQQVEKLPLLAKVLFATGCRWGELPIAHYKAGSIVIRKQVDRKGIERQTKNRRVREAPIIPPLEHAVVEYYSLPREERIRMRMQDDKNLRLALLGLIRIHDLRHSYAIAWAERGATIEQVADYIGDSVAVCRDHYLTYVKSSRQMQLAAALWIDNK